MSAATKVVVLSSFSKTLDRVLDALNGWADSRDKAAAFEKIGATKHLYVDDVQVIVGKANHADWDELRAVIRDGAADPNWSTAYFSTSVFLQNELDDGPAVAFRLTDDGEWV